MVDAFRLRKDVTIPGPVAAGAPRAAEFAGARPPRLAPAAADTLPFLMFAPIVDGPGSAYPGLDQVALTAVPLPAAGWLPGGVIALLTAKGAAFRSRRRRARR